MSVTDHPVWYYQQRDITDPTPYEEDNRILDGEVCYRCECVFHCGDRIMQIEAPCFDRVLVHEDCYDALFHSVEERTRFECIMDRLGYEISEAEEEEE